MKGAIAVLLLSAMMLAGCTTGSDTDGTGPDGSGDPGTVTDPLQPARGNGVLYLHSQGSELWMSTNATATATSVAVTYAVAGGQETWSEFPLRPTTSEDLVFSGAPVLVDPAVSVETVVGMNPVTKARLLVGGQAVDEAEVDGTGVPVALSPPGNVSAGTELAVAVCICPQTGTLAYNAELHTDGSSMVALDLESPVAGSAVQSAPGIHRGPIETTQRPDGEWRASQQVTVVGDHGGADRADWTLRSVNGHATAAAGSGSDYTVVAQLEARADTETQARQRLQELRVRHDADIGATATVSVVVEDTGPDPKWRKKSADLQADLPDTHYTSLDVRTTNGRVAADGFDGQTLRLASTNGEVRAESIAFQEVDASTTNSPVTVTGTVDDLEAGTTNGGVTIDARAAASGSWSGSATNGDVRVTVPESGSRGYDVEGSTTNGEVTFDFSETEPMGQQSRTQKHERTQGYADRGIQTAIDLSSTNGSVTAQGG